MQEHLIIDGNNALHAIPELAHHFTPNPALASLEVGRGSPVLKFNELAQEITGFDGLTNVAAEMVLEECLRRVETVDARDRRDDDTVRT